MKREIVCGDALEVLRGLPDESVHCCVTSPPYWSLRDYGVEGQLGLEETMEEYVEKIVEVFREVRRVLRNDSTLWLNLGDSYASSGVQGPNSGLAKLADRHAPRVNPRNPNRDDIGDVPRAERHIPIGLKPKDLVGIPWRVAFALQADGWWLRSDIIWAKPNPMPESVTDRCTKSHEYIFMLSKSARYYYDHEAIKQASVSAGENRGGGLKYSDREHNNGIGGHHNLDKYGITPDLRNKRDVWTVSTKPFKGAHFAVFPPELIRPCILAGCAKKVCAVCGAPLERQVEKTVGTSKSCPKTQAAHESRGGTGVPCGTVGKSGSGRTDGTTKTVGFKPTCDCNSGTNGGTVLDPFFGAGTTGLVAKQEGRGYIGIELNPEYAEMARERIKRECPMERLI